MHEFYSRIGKTPSLDHYFANTDMEALISHQTKFLCQVLGGPSQYTGRQLTAAHQSLKIPADDFDLVVDILEETLEDAGVEDADLETIMGIVASVRGAVVYADEDSAAA